MKDCGTTDKATPKLTVAAVAAVLAVAVGGMVLTGWALDISMLKSILPGWVSMKPNTALAFVLTGVALPLVSRSPSLLSRLGRLCGLLAGLIGLLTLAEYVYGWNPGFDQWLFSEPAGAVATSNPGRMAPDAALCFVLLAAGLEIVYYLRRTKRRSLVPMILGALVTAVALASILTCFTPELGAFGWMGLTNMAVPTAAMFAVLGAAMALSGLRENIRLWSLGLRTAAAFGAGLMLLMGIGLYTSRSVIHLADTVNRITQAENVLHYTAEVMGEAAATQTHTRGYVITGGERYLDAQRAAARQCRATLAGLWQLIAADPSQRARAARLEAQVDETLQRFSNDIESRRANGPGGVPLDVVNHGEDLMDNLRATAKEMQDSENELLQAYQAESERVSLLVQTVIFTGTAVGLVILLTTLLKLNRIMTERNHIDGVRRQEQAMVLALMDNLPDHIYFKDTASRFIRVNPAHMRSLGANSPAQVTGKTDADFFPAEHSRKALADEQNILRTGQALVDIEEKVIGPAGDESWVLTTKLPLRDDTGRITGTCGISSDITGRKRAEQHIQQLNRVYAVLSDINQAIVREKDPQAMLETVCRIAVEKGQFRMAWIGMLNPVTQELQPAAASGAVEGFTELARIDLRDRTRATGPSARCLLSGEHAVCNDIARDPLYLPWRDEALRRGYQSSGAFPIKVDGQIIGTFNLYAGMPGVFDEEELRLLDELAMDVSFAIEVGRREEKRRQAEAALLESQALYFSLVEQLPVGVYRKDAEGRYVFVNSHFCEIENRPREQYLGKFPHELPGVDAWLTEQAGQQHAAIMQTGRPVEVDEIQTRPGGRQAFFRVIKSPVFNAEGKVIGSQGILFDITGQKQAEREVQRLAAFARYNPNPVLELSVTGEIIYFNAAALQMANTLGWEHPAQILPPNTAAIVRDCLATNQPALRLETRHGNRTLSWSFFPVAQTHAVHCYAGDITGRKEAETVLRNSEALLKNAQVIAGLGTYILDILGDRWSSSDVLDGILGIDKTYERSLAGWAALIHPADRAAMVDYFKNEVAGRGRPFDKEYRIVRHNDHAELWVHGLGRLEFDAQGRPVRMVGTIQDITGRKRADEALRASEERFRTLFDKAGDGILLLSDEGRILSVNESFARMHGYSREEIMCKGLKDLDTPDSFQKAPERMRRQLAGEEFNFEAEHYHKDGHVIMLEVSAGLVSLGGKNVIQAFHRDITERKRAGEAHARLATAVEQSAESIVITDIKGTILYVNPAFEQISGYTRTEAIGKNPRILKSGKQDTEFYRQMWAALTRGEVWHGHFMNKRKDGSFYEEQATISPIRTLRAPSSIMWPSSAT
jgi:PAS domain S-box-containing protein